MLQNLAKTDIDIFIEYIAKDASGNSVFQGKIHNEIQWHIDECRRRGLQNALILAPWGHGKTEQIIFRLLDDIGKNPNIRAQIICNTDENATARVTSIAKYIEFDEDYKKVYPWIKPGEQSGDAWGRHKLVVERTSKAKDGTVESWGITTSGTGSRADLQIFDDPVDLRNAILNPALREQVKESFKNVWLSRLVPTGFRIYIATVWHEDDLTNELIRSSEWNCLIMKVSEDFKNIECSSCFKGDYNIPLWDYWNENKLKSQFKLLRERAFNRGYRQRALSDEDRTFPSSESIFNDQLLANDMVNPNWVKCLGMDPFGKKSVIFVIALNPYTRARIPVCIKLGHWKPKEAILHLRDTYLEHMPQICVVENNAAQDAIVQWAKEIGGLDIPILPFCTGKQKADPEMGLPSLEVEFANGAWIVPMKGIDPTDSENPYNIWRRELRSHPVGEAEDTVMACWFAREGARYLTRDTSVEEQEGEIVHQEEMGVEEVVIGSYD